MLRSLRLTLVLILILVAASSLTVATAEPQTALTEFDVPTRDAGPLAIAVDGHGTIWFTESDAGKIGKFSPSNASFVEYEVPGSAREMWGILVSVKGLVYFTDYSASASPQYTGIGTTANGTGRIWQLEPLTVRFRSFTIPTLGSFPMQLVEDASGNVWFTEFLGNKIGVLNPSTGTIREFNLPTPNSGPTGITIDRKGRIWFTESYTQKLGVFDPSTARFEEYSLPKTEIFSPVGVAVHEDGKVWLADHGFNWIARFDPTEGSLVKYPTSHPPREVYPVSIPNGLIIDREGDIWFSEHAGNKIGRFNEHKREMVEYHIPTGPVSTVLWLADGRDGKIWFAEYTGNKIGFVDKTVSVTLRMSAPLTIRVSSGDRRVAIPVEIENLSQFEVRLSINASWSSTHTRGMSVDSGPYTLDMRGGSKIQSTVPVRIAESVKPGAYMLLVSASKKDLTLSRVVEVNIPQPDFWVSPRNFLPLIIGIIFGAFASILLWQYKIRKRPGTESLKEQQKPIR